MHLAGRSAHILGSQLLALPRRGPQASNMLSLSMFHSLALLVPPPHLARRSIVQMASTLPKAETGVQKLLESYPDADGRGTLVAVLDTGCDLAAAGLLTTTDGRPKYIDFVDCTGGGDIDTSKTAKPAADGRTIEGLSGRTLKLGSWAEGVDEFRLGALRLFALGAHASGANCGMYRT